MHIVFGVKILVNLSHKKKAFTLAELLVAMLVFGVIAAMLIPNVSNNAEKNLFATQLLKVQNDVQQALLLLMSENQGTLQALCSGTSASECLKGLISEKLESKVEYSGAKEETGCDEKLKPDKNPCIQQAAFEARDPIFLNGDKPDEMLSWKKTEGDYKGYSAVNLTNGATVSVVFAPACTSTTQEGLTTFKADDDNLCTKTCGYIEIDINAGKKPNIVGKDIHYFWIVDKDGLVPFGEIDDATCGAVDDATGDVTTNVTKATDSLTQFGCTFKLVQDGKINYY